jgi:TrmH family RNA methyltransferase
MAPRKAVKTITSSDNPLIKSVRRLQHRTGSRSEGRFLLEGVKLAYEALESGIDIEHAILSKSFAQSEAGRNVSARFAEAAVDPVQVPASLLSRLSSLDNPEGVLLVAKKNLRSLDNRVGDLVLVLVGIQDPGNAGAMVRVAEAAGASSLVKCRGSVDPYQPRALRASMGSLLRLPVYEAGEPASALPLLKEQGLCLAACVPRGGRDFRDAKLGHSLALVVGSESTGLPDHLLKLVDIRVSVPMKASVESLNVAFVAGLLLYEAARQRGTL